MQILVQDSSGVRPLEEGYASEEELQSFLREHFDLMPLEEIELGAPPLLCIGWEVGLASGAEDILFIDETGLLTMVETKLRRNPEARREVVGQVLEYAAHMSAWTTSDVERQAETFFASPRCLEPFRNCSLQTAMNRFLEARERAEAFSYDDFLQAVQTYIDQGRFRLVIAIDEAPDPLLKTVEFVNQFSERFEMYLVQLKRFHDSVSQQNIFVPALFGRVATSRKQRGRREWNEDKFFEHMASTTDTDTVNYCKAIFEVLRELADVPLWGTGTKYGSFNLVLVTNGTRINVATLTTSGTLGINFGWMSGKVSEAILDHMLQQFREVPGLATVFPPRALTKWPVIPQLILKDSSRRAKILGVIRDAVERIRSSE